MTDAALEDVVTEQIWTPRRELLVSSWLDKKLKAPDFLLGNIVSTTSRILLYGETGVGKTLFAMAALGAIAAGQTFLNWDGRRKVRVMYLDGEMPAQTFQDRVKLISALYGRDIEFYGYNRDILEPNALPPLNTDAGQAWLNNEINLIKPDFIVFDSIMSLLVGVMAEEESWKPMLPFIRSLSARHIGHIGQMWLHHTGHDTSRGFGTKTREWEMDTVIALSKVDDGSAGSTSVQLEFKKARLRTPETSAQFLPRVISFTEQEGWIIEGAAKRQAGKLSDVDIIRNAILAAYDRLSDGIKPVAGFDGALVRKIGVDALRDEVKSRGFMETTETGAISGRSRLNFSRAKTVLFTAGKMAEADNLIWRL